MRPLRLSDCPLLIAAHGSGGSGPKEIEGWLDLESGNFVRKEYDLNIARWQK
jgi:hypothetical protein